MTIADADLAAAEARRRSAERFETEPCRLCKGERRLYVSCKPCGGTGKQVKGFENRQAHATALDEIELARLRRCWVVTRDDLRTARERLANPPEGSERWALEGAIESLERQLARYHALGAKQAAKVKRRAARGEEPQRRRRR